MFGILYALLFGGACTVGKIRENIENSQWKDYAIDKRNKEENRENLYRDHRGIYRDLNTGQPRVQYFNKYGEACLSDIHGNTVRNLSREKINEEWMQRVKGTDGHPKAVFYETWNVKNSKLREDGPICGDVYKDVQTGELYFKRVISWDRDNYAQGNFVKHNAMIYEFYMRISDGTLAGTVDEWEEKYEKFEKYRKFYIKPSEHQIIDFILFFNEKQKEGGWKNYCDRDLITCGLSGQHGFYLYHK